MKRLAVCLLLVACLTVSIKSQSSIVDTMVNKLKKANGGLGSDQISNARAIMQACSAYTTSVNQLAYVLSTAIGESNLRPIKEYRAKAGTALYNIQNKYWGTGFYGRGYVQLTWKSNYEKFGKLLNVNLVGSPDLALRADIAGKIICIGMTRGLFTGVGLNTYFASGKADWTNARRIINGISNASQFGDRARRIATA